MKTVLLVIVSLVAGFSGLIVGMMIGGFGICAASIDRSLVILAIGIGAGAVILGAAFGRKISWIPVVAYCVPLALFGGLLPIVFPEWDRVIAGWSCAAVVAVFYGLCYFLLGAVRKNTGNA